MLPAIARNKNFFIDGIICKYDISRKRIGNRGFGYSLKPPDSYIESDCDKIYEGCRNHEQQRVNTVKDSAMARKQIA